MTDNRSLTRRWAPSFLEVWLMTSELWHPRNTALGVMLSCYLIVQQRHFLVTQPGCEATCNNMGRLTLHAVTIFLKGVCTEVTHWLFTQPLWRLTSAGVMSYVAMMQSGELESLASVAHILLFSTMCRGVCCSTVPKVKTLAHIRASSWWHTTIFYYFSSWALFHAGWIVVTQRPLLLC